MPTPPVYDHNVRKDGVIAVLDHGTGMSVTNAAETVIAELHAQGLDLRRVIYRDTDGNWDGLAVTNPRIGPTFSGFVPLHTTDEDEAAAKALAMSEAAWWGPWKS